MIDLFIAAVIATSPKTDSCDWDLDLDDGYYLTCQPCDQWHPCLNGHEPSYNDPDCWPGAIYCPPPQSIGYPHKRGHRK